MRTVPKSQLIQIALDRVSSSDFESFGHTLMTVVRGTEYRPLGGMHDGGADGFVDDGVLESIEAPSSFVQTSTHANPSDKISQTIGRLKEVGRDPRQLLYVTNRVVPQLDQLANRLGTRHGTAVQIYDAKYIEAQIPLSRALVNSYYQFLHHNTLFLQSIDKSQLLVQSDHISDPHVYTYLAAHLAEDDTDTTFVDGVVDALIIYALEGTDPDAGILRTEAEIRAKILKVLPSADALLQQRLRNRLEAISRKGNRRVRWHKKEQRWALPFEERQRLEEAAAEDAALWLTVKSELMEKFSHLQLPGQLEPNNLAELTLSTIRKAFERDGLRFAHFLSDDEAHDSGPFISDSLREVLNEHALTGDNLMAAADAIGMQLRNMFYDSTPTQRTLLQRISRAYVVAFTLKAEPRVLKYFDDVMDDTLLYVGSDVLVVALSERYLAESDQHTRNLLRAAALAGAHLVLAAPVLDEVLAHLRGSDRDYMSESEFYSSIRDYELVRHEPKILIRAYLYSQLFEVENKPRSWQQFVSQFCDYRSLHADSAVDLLRDYLRSEFSLRFENWRRVHETCGEARHDRLKESLRSIKQTEIQASIDAYMFDLVVQARESREEEQRAIEFGYQTWWLSSGEGSAVRAMSRVDRTAERVLMRPGFLSKYIQFAPSAAQARQQLGDFLPSLLGIRLGRRLAEEDFDRVMSAVSDAESFEPGGRASKISALVDELKSAHYEEYRFDFDASAESLSFDIAS